jgi:DNA-binding transcriptional regulator YdaS (Cro superfamily)
VGQLGWVVAALGALAIAMPASAQAAAQWNSGAAQESTITDCVSIINGDPQSSPGVAVTPYVYEDYSNPPPAGTPFELAVRVYGIGDSCSGQAADIEMQLPTDLQLAISSATQVTCHELGPNAAGTMVVDGPADTSGACPQNPASLGNNTYSFNMARNSGFAATSFYPFWAIPQGYGVEIDIPVVATAGPFTANATAIVQMADGNSDPTLDPTVPVSAAMGTTTDPGSGNEAVIDPLVSNLTSTSATLNVMFDFNYSLFGNPKIDWGYSANTYPGSLGFNYTFAQPPFEVGASVGLTGLDPGCTYHWDGEMTDAYFNGPNQTVGTGDQSFTTPGTRGVCTAGATPGPGGTTRVFKRPPLTVTTTPTSPFGPVTPEINPTKKPTTPTPTPHTTVVTPLAFTGVQLPAVQRGNLLKLQLTVGLADSRVEVDVFLPAVQRGKHRHKQELLGKLVKTRVAKGRLIMKIRLNSAGRRLLHQRRSLRLSLKLIVTPPGGKPASVTKPMTLHP